MRIAIVTDSTADIPQNLAESLNIKVIPLSVHFGGRAYLDRIDISNEEFYSYIGTAKTLPTTSQPSPAQYLQDHPDASWDAILECVQAIIKKTRIYFLLDTLDNLQKGGRIGKASYLVGSILNIKPVLVVEDGFISAYEKIRGKKIEKAVDHLTDIVVKMIDPTKTLHIVLGYNNEAYLDILKNSLLPKLVAHLDDQGIAPDSYELGSVVTTHIGLGGIGVAFYQL